MKQFFLVTLMAVLWPVQLLAQDVSQIFVYSPGERNGLHVAVETDDGWQHLGQLCSSDYGPWGVEKRMFNPSLCRAADGAWRLVFQLNDRTPTFAVAYSRDLITWRPQDYPHMSVGPCLEPVVTPNDNGTCYIYYKTKSGQRRRVTASEDFRRFSDERTVQPSEQLWHRDTATIDGKLHEGCQLAVTPSELSALQRHFEWLAVDARLSGERMHDDASNPLFSNLGSLTATLTVEPGRELAISDKLIGIFFEDISYAADGGLYAELVQNRDFEYSDRDRREWSATTAWHSPAPIRIDTDQPLSVNNPHYALLTNDTLWNEGWDGIAVEAGKDYDFSMYVRNGKVRVKSFEVGLATENGDFIAKTVLNTDYTDWQRFEAVLSPAQTCDKARLVIVPLEATEVAVDMVSLFPRETFKNRKNGLRRDLAETIAAMHPKFVRFPGGCMTHGQGLENIYHWHETIGPLQDRKPDFNIWHYHQTRGLGFYEYFQFCEDIGAEPLPVLAAGVPCQNSAANAEGFAGQQGGIPMADMPAYIQELLDLIDWANGDPATSPWARKRAEAGHPEPFNLKYIGIGNEDIIGTVFEDRYEMICRAIRERYPDIKVCGTVGPFHYPSADYTEGWELIRRHPDLQYMTDEHYYESTGWFLHHRDYYDRYDRSLPKVYLGEWAASTKTKRPNVETALAEAIYLTDIERNGDIVEMTSYAPMLCKDGHSNWNPDMIYFSNTTVRTTPAYEVQRLFSVYGGDRYVSSRLELSPEAGASALAHRLAASVVRDSKTGRTVLKLVNALPCPLTVSVRGLDIPASARYEGFSGQPEDQRLQMQTGEVGSVLTLPPYSLRAIEL